MSSLTRTEAETRAAAIDVRQYTIALDLTGAGDAFDCDTTIVFAARPGHTDTFLDLRAASVQTLELNGEPLAAELIVDGRLPLSGLQAENVLRVVATMSYSSDGEGLHRHVDPADGRTYLYAMSFLDQAPRWFACFDQPDLKATYRLQVRCSPDWTVVGNGPATRVSPGRWSLAETEPLSTYFVTLVAGPYHSVIAEHDGIVLGLHARTSLAAHLDLEAPDMLEVTRAAFDRYHELFGIRYPFGEYHQAFVPDFNAGAMENPGCVTLRDSYVYRSAATHSERGERAGTIAHEMAHMWFGDLVTMGWWDDLWLNESFAEYLAQRVCSEVTDYDAWIDFGIRRKDWGSVADQAPSTHPVAGNGSADAAAALADFDGISYAKGAAVLKQLAAYLGDDVFFAGLRAHFAAHRFGNAGFTDLIASWTAAGAQQLSEWATQWLRTSGMDTVTGQARHSGLTVEVTVERAAHAATNRTHAVRVAGYDLSGSQVLDEPVLLGAEPLRLSAPADTALVVADGNDDTWAKVRFAPDGWVVLPEVLPRITHAPSRVVVFNAVRDAVRDAELDPAQALDLVLSGVRVEADELIIAEMLRFTLDQLVGVYSPPQLRAERRRAVAALAAELLSGAAPASDLQLASARAVMTGTDDASLLRDWLAGDRVPDGLVLDAELRWSATCRLAALGALDEVGIAAELARDPSTSGVLHAARARASRPDPQAKAAAWSALTEPSGIPAYELYATAEGMFLPEQDELTEPYAVRYFADMPGTARHRHGWALARVALSSYPRTHASADLLALAEATLLQAGLDPGIHRSLADGTDVVRRAVRSQARFAG